MVCLFFRYIVLQYVRPKYSLQTELHWREPWPRDAIGSQQTAAGPVGPRGDDNISAI